MPFEFAYCVLTEHRFVSLSDLRPLRNVDQRKFPQRTSASCAKRIQMPEEQIGRWHRIADHNDVLRVCKFLRRLSPHWSNCLLVSERVSCGRNDVGAGCWGRGAVNKCSVEYGRSDSQTKNTCTVTHKGVFSEAGL